MNNRKPGHHGGIVDIRMPANLVWKPDVLVYNSAEPSKESFLPTNVKVSSDGLMQWVPPGVLRTTCRIDITW